MLATIIETDMPGLFDVSLSDGRELSDLTMGQIHSLANNEGWIVEPQTP